jgi:2-iminoacetate synthase ThiH
MSADAHMHHFAVLSAGEQHEAIHKLARSGMGDYSIAAATRLSVEMVRKILGERKASEATEA